MSNSFSGQTLGAWEEWVKYVPWPVWKSAWRYKFNVENVQANFNFNFNSQDVEAIIKAQAPVGLGPYITAGKVTYSFDSRISRPWTDTSELREYTTNNTDYYIPPNISVPSQQDWQIIKDRILWEMEGRPSDQTNHIRNIIQTNFIDNYANSRTHWYSCRSNSGAGKAWSEFAYAYTFNPATFSVQITKNIVGTAKKYNIKIIQTDNAWRYYTFFMTSNGAPAGNFNNLSDISPGEHVHLFAAAHSNWQVVHQEWNYIVNVYNTRLSSAIDITKNLDNPLAK